MADDRSVRHEVLLREANHRFGNDLQLVVGLLTAAARRAHCDETREVACELAERVGVLGQARAALLKDSVQTLDAVLARTCEGLNSQTEPRGILLTLAVRAVLPVLRTATVTTLALVANELVTNAIKHAFDGRESGQVAITLDCPRHDEVMMTVEDDGAPFAINPLAGSGLSLVRHLLESIDAILVLPEGESKRIAIRVLV